MDGDREPNPIRDADPDPSGSEGDSGSRSNGGTPAVGSAATARGPLSRVVSAGLVGMVRLYQLTLSPFLGNVCRFEPSCSRYMIGAIEKHGPIRGVLKGIGRLLRCHPLHPGGYDPP